MISTRSLRLGIVLLCCICASAQEGEKKFVDTHVHLNEFVGPDMKGPTNKDPKVDSMSAAKSILKQMDEYHVDKAMLVTVTGHDYKNILDVVKQYPSRFYLCIGGDIMNPILQATKPDKVTEELKKDFEMKARKLVELGTKGFGEMMGLHVSMANDHSFQYASPDHPLYFLLSDIAAENNLPIDIHTEAVLEEMPTPQRLKDWSDKNPDKLPATIPQLEKLLSHNRKTNIVWQHIGWDNTGNMTVELLSRLLTDHPNLFLALKIEEVNSRRKPMPNRFVDEKMKINPAWLDLIKKFPDRFMIGSDEFMGVEGKSKRMPHSFREIWGVVDQLPDETRKKVCIENATRLYNLK